LTEDSMSLRLTDGPSTLIAQIEARVRDTTSNRVRDLLVEQSEDGVVVRGQVRSRHTKQLALHAALELLPDGWLRDQIVVG
jgi:hypothetical protein